MDAGSVWWDKFFGVPSRCPSYGDKCNSDVKPYGCVLQLDESHPHDLHGGSLCSKTELSW